MNDEEFMTLFLRLKKEYPEDELKLWRILKEVKEPVKHEPSLYLQSVMARAKQTNSVMYNVQRKENK